MIAPSFRWIFAALLAWAASPVSSQTVPPVVFENDDSSGRGGRALLPSPSEMLSAGAATEHRPLYQKLQRGQVGVSDMRAWNTNAYERLDHRSRDDGNAKASSAPLMLAGADISNLMGGTADADRHDGDKRGDLDHVPQVANSDDFAPHACGARWSAPSWGDHRCGVYPASPCPAALRLSPLTTTTTEKRTTSLSRGTTWGMDCGSCVTISLRRDVTFNGVCSNGGICPSLRSDLVVRIVGVISDGNADNVADGRLDSARNEDGHLLRGDTVANPSLNLSGDDDDDDNDDDGFGIDLDPTGWRQLCPFVCDHQNGQNDPTNRDVAICVADPADCANGVRTEFTTAKEANDGQRYDRDNKNKIAHDSSVNDYHKERRPVFVGPSHPQQKSSDGVVADAYGGGRLLLQLPKSHHDGNTFQLPPSAIAAPQKVTIRKSRFCKRSNAHDDRRADNDDDDGHGNTDGEKEEQRHGSGDDGDDVELMKQSFEFRVASGVGDGDGDTDGRTVALTPVGRFFSIASAFLGISLVGGASAATL